MVESVITAKTKKRSKYISPLDQATGIDRFFNIIVYAYMSLCFFVTVYPVLVVFSSSFSSPAAVSGGQVWLYPIGFNLKGYESVFRNPQVITGYSNSAYYAIFGTAINVTLTVMAAYPLSRKDFSLRRPVMLIFAFTMFFSGGMVPNFILVNNLGIMNTRWAMLLPGALSVYNMILTRTYFQSSLPDELLEAAQLDGCSDFTYIRTVAIPLSKPILAVITLYYAVGHWNAFFNAFLYLRNNKLFPLQLVLRSVIMLNQVDPSTISTDSYFEQQAIRELMRYSLIVVACVPMLILYPFVQKFFIRGVMIGSIKG